MYFNLKILAKGGTFVVPFLMIYVIDSRVTWMHVIMLITIHPKAMVKLPRTPDMRAKETSFH